MGDFFYFLLLGLGIGAAYALGGIGVTLTARASNVLNFAHGATGAFLTYAFFEFRETGDLVLPVAVPVIRLHLVPQPTVGTALGYIVVYAALLGAAQFWLIFRWTRTAPPLTRVVASVGLFLYFWATTVVIWSDSAPAARPILPTEGVTIGGRLIGQDRLVVAATAVAIGAGLWAIYRFTPFGLATTAAAENDKGARLTGLRPELLATVNWGVATVLSAISTIFVSNYAGLDPLQLGLLVVPAFAAALLGGFRSFVWVAAAGFAIGIGESELTRLTAGGLGWSKGLPFLVIVITLVIRGDSLPGRGESVDRRLPVSPEPRWTTPLTVVGLGIGVAVMFALGSDWRQAAINSAIAMVMALAVVVLTGYVGQISLAPYAFAGVAGLLLAKFDDLGLGFPGAPIAAIAVTGGFGLVVGIPAVRARGVQLAIVTIGATVAIEQLLFKWSWLMPNTGVVTAPEPRVGSVNLGITATGSDFPRSAFGVLVVVVAALCFWTVANLRRSRTGLGWLAVRANERAAAAAGVDVRRAKLTSFAVSATIAGIGGVLLAYRFGTVETQNYQLFVSLGLVAVTCIGGVASAGGGAVAGFITQLGLLTLIANGGEVPPEVSPYSFVVSGVLLIVTAIFLPGGIVDVRRRLTGLIASRRTQPVAG